MKKTETKSTVLLAHHLKALKLPTILAECVKVASRCASDNVDHLGFLLQLCELELLERERKADSRGVQCSWILHIVDARNITFKNAGRLIKGAAPLQVEAMTLSGVQQGSDSFQLSRYAWNAGGWG